MQTFKTIVTLALFFACQVDYHGQQAWLTTTDEHILVDQISGTKITDYHVIGSLNHHPCIQFGTSMKLPLTSQSGLTILSVFQHKKSSEEKLIWSINDAIDDQVLLTTKRLADLSQSKYMTFGSSEHEQQLHTYFNTAKSGNSPTLNLGSTPLDSAIPVKKFDGCLTELIIYDRVISPITLEILQSILALKYGLTLAENHNYTSPDKQVIWSRTQHDYQHRISGIGRYDQVHFNQSKSTSAMEEGTLTLSYNLPWKEGELVAWADDGSPIDFMINNGIETLSREWRMENFQSRNLSLEIKIDHKSLLDDLDEDYSLVAVIKPVNSSSYLAPLTVKGAQFFGNFNLHPGSQYIRFAKVPSFWALVDVDSPPCNSQTQASLTIQIQGGTPPFRLKIANEQDLLVDLSQTERKLYIDDLVGSRPRITITDKEGNTWTSNISLNHSDIEDPNLPYTLTKSSDFQIIPYDHDKYQCSWIDPQGHQIARPHFEPTSVGLHHLLVNDGECQNHYEFMVTDEKSTIESFKVYPNPAADDIQHLSARLSMVSPYAITATDMGGKVFHSSKYPAGQYIYHKLRLPAGLYLITLTSTHDIQHQKLIVVKS